MDLAWSWLDRGKNREDNSSDEDKNLKHRRKSWSEVVRDSLVKEVQPPIFSVSSHQDVLL